MYDLNNTTMLYFYVIQKELIQLFRQKIMVGFIFIMPIVQLIVLGSAATFEIKNANIAIIDHDHSDLSRSLSNTFNASPFFTITEYCQTYSETEVLIAQNKTDQILEIPNGFAKELKSHHSASLLLHTNAINGSFAGVISSYAQQIIRDFQKREVGGHQSPIQLSTTVRYWFNKQLDYQSFMLPGLVIILVTLIGFFMAGINIVREKELGTIDQINVTPIKRHQFIICKLLPFLLIGLVEFIFGIGIAKLVFDIPINGSLWLSMLFVMVYLILMLSFALLISTISETQQQSLLVSWFFMVVFLLLSGLFTPIESMPEWVKYINSINPLSYMVQVIRMILLKGSTFRDLIPDFIGLSTVALLMVVVATRRYRKTA